MPHSRRKGQTAMEYLLLLGVVVALVLIAFKTQLPRTRESANIYFNRATLGIIGEPNPCGDGLCCPPFEDAARCPPDCDVSGGGVVECPGAVCTNPFDPTNYTVCAGSDAGLIASESWALVANGGCTGGKCEYECNVGFMPSPAGDTCIPSGCTCPDGTYIASGGSCPTLYFQTSLVPCGNTCSAPEVRTCTSGVLSGSYTSASCSVAACAPCTCPDGSIIPSGTICPVAYYQFSSVACGSNCGVPETRACFDGNLSGSYTNATCSVALCPCPSPCGHGSIASGSTDTCYSTSSVACGGDCASFVQTATCSNGLWSSGTFTSYTASSCSVAICASCPDVCGSVLPHGGSKTCYQSSSVACGSSCVSETRTCNDGTATGSYTSGSCSVQPCCGVNGCQSGIGETCFTCSADCGVCCGNGSCDDGAGGRPNYGESCSTCPADCPCPTWTLTSSGCVSGCTVLTPVPPSPDGTPCPTLGATTFICDWGSPPSCGSTLQRIRQWTCL